MILNPNTPQLLLRKCISAGIHLTPRGGDELTVKGAREAVTPQLLELLKKHKLDLIDLLQHSARQAVDSQIPGESSLKCSCGSTDFLDFVLRKPPHYGRSVRRDCKWCQRTLRFVRWYGLDK